MSGAKADIEEDDVASVYTADTPVGEPLPPRPFVSEPRPLTTWRGAGRVLVVDDEPSVARLTALVLDQYGFEVQVAASGREALEQIARAPAGYTLVVVDLSMPDLSGVDVLNHARALGCVAPMVLTSGHSSTDTERVLASSTFAGYLQKPYRLETLLEVIQQALATG
jgi:DNA-binding response OmpR family regulator